MNVLGIDHEQLTGPMSLREGRSPHWPPATIREEGPSPEDHSPESHSMLRRLDSFLGGNMAAVNVDLTIIAATRTVGPSERAEIIGLFQDVRFGLAHLIDSGKAALLAALQGRPPEGRDDWPERISVVVVGEECTAVYGYRLETLNRASRVTAEAAGQVIEQIGASQWINCVLDQVRDACGELDSSFDPRARLAASEIGWMLGNAANDQQRIRWLGPFCDRMPHPIYFCKREAYEWRSSRELAEVLPSRLIRSAQDCGGTLPEAVIIAGVGAAWPFARVAVSRICSSVVALNRPELALARGAAWWPNLGESIFELVQTPVTLLAQREVRVEAAPARLADLDLLSRHISSETKTQ